jgi:hypothetical protein
MRVRLDRELARVVELLVRRRGVVRVAVADEAERERVPLAFARKR